MCVWQKLFYTVLIFGIEVHLQAQPQLPPYFQHISNTSSFFIYVVPHIAMQIENLCSLYLPSVREFSQLVDVFPLWEWDESQKLIDIYLCLSRFLITNVLNRQNGHFAVNRYHAVTWVAVLNMVMLKSSVFIFITLDGRFQININGKRALFLS